MRVWDTVNAFFKSCEVTSAVRCITAWVACGWVNRISVAIAVCWAVSHAVKSRLQSFEFDNNNICVHTEDARETSYLFQRIFIMLQRFNSVLMRDTLSVDLPDLWPSDILIFAFLVFNPADLYYHNNSNNTYDDMVLSSWLRTIASRAFQFRQKGFHSIRFDSAIW